LQQPVPALLLTAAQARERRKAFAAALPAESGSTAAVDLMADFMFSESMLGRYLPDEKALYVISDVLERVAARGGRGDRQAAEDVLFGVLAHELTHAYDDQTYHLIPQPSDIKELVLDPTGLVEIQARMSLLEGRATWIAELACARVGRPPLETLSLDEARSAEVLSGRADEGGAQSVGRGLVNAIGRAKLVQYAYGREFARRAWAFGGEKFFAEVVTHLPLTLAELEDFELFRQRWAREEGGRARGGARRRAGSGRRVCSAGRGLSPSGVSRRRAAARGARARWPGCRGRRWPSSPRRAAR
jgi:hypothetical protein